MSRDKIKPAVQLQEILMKHREAGKKVVQCHGTFDLLHPGHLKHMEAAKAFGDLLVVSITGDKWVNRGPGRPVYNQNVRSQFIAGFGCVDYVVIDEGDRPIKLLKRLRPDVFVKGGDYEEQAYQKSSLTCEEREAVESYGGKMKFTHEDLVMSSSQLINDFFSVYPESTQLFLDEFKSRYNFEQINGYFEKTRNLKVLVLGDTIVDEYHYGSVVGASSKENMLVFRYEDSESFAGGVVATANNAAPYSKSIRLCTLLGDHESKENYIRQHIDEKIDFKTFYKPGSCTVVNRRFAQKVFMDKLFEEYFINEKPIDDKTEKGICDYLETVIGDYDLVMVNDFGFGFVGRQMIDVICSKSKLLAVNTQTNSMNRGYNLITKYPRMDYMCIDQPEIRLAMADKYSDIQSMIRSLVKRMESSKISVTLGHNGAMTYDREKDAFYEVPVLSKKVVDRIGAGDAYFAVTSPCVAVGMPMDCVGFVGNAVGAIAVTIVCNRNAVVPDQLNRFLNTLLK